MKWFAPRVRLPSAEGWLYARPRKLERVRKLRVPTKATQQGVASGAVETRECARLEHGKHRDSTFVRPASHHLGYGAHAGFTFASCLSEENGRQHFLTVGRGGGSQRPRQSEATAQEQQRQPPESEA